MRPALLLLLLALGCAPHPEAPGARPIPPTPPAAQKPAGATAPTEQPPKVSAAARDADLPPLPHLGPVAGEDPDTFFQRGRLAEALLLLETARQNHPDRIETYYNEGILLQEYAPLFDTQNRMRAIVRGRYMLQLFIERAGDDPQHADAVRVAQSRLQAIKDATEGVFNEPASARKERQEAEKRRAAEEESELP